MYVWGSETDRLSCLLWVRYHKKSMLSKRFNMYRLQPVCQTDKLTDRHRVASRQAGIQTDRKAGKPEGWQIFKLACRLPDRQVDSSKADRQINRKTDSQSARQTETLKIGDFKATGVDSCPNYSGFKSHHLICHSCPKRALQTYAIRRSTGFHS